MTGSEDRVVHPAQSPPSPLSETSLTKLLSALREQHTGAPTVAPLITRVADPAFRREAPAALSATVARIQEPPPGAPADGIAEGGEQRRVLIPVNLSGLLGAAGSMSR